MSSQGLETKNLTLKGSAQIVKDYFYYALNNILYQKGIGTPKHYEQVNFYGLNLFVCKNSVDARYITKRIDEIEKQLERKEVKNLRLVILNRKTHEVLERWLFNVSYENGRSSTAVDLGTKNEKVVQNEISAVMRQILGVSTVLPLHDPIDLSFRISIGLMPGVLKSEVKPKPKKIKIQNEQLTELTFRSFSTSIHKVDSKVYYKGN